MNISTRPLKREDAYTSVKWRNDPDVFKYTENVYSHIITIESELEWIEKVMQKEDDYRCAIIDGEKYIGNIYLTDINDGVADYHIFIGEKDYWGSGAAKIASELLFDYARNTLHLSRINLGVNIHNERALGLYKKLGFKETKFENNWRYMSLLLNR